jgi:polyribonucleotide nucleotidyltransferase
MSTKHEVAVELAGGKRLVFETGRMAKQASGAALVTTGETVVLATAVASPDPREGIDFFPLTVDYREYTYAGGRIPGGFIKREGRPSEKEVLTCRQIDRPIRPLFPDGFRNETQVIALVFSADKENDPDVIGINAAAAALALSDIPFSATVGAVREPRRRLKKSSWLPLSLLMRRSRRLSPESTSWLPSRESPSGHSRLLPPMKPTTKS